MVIGIFVQQPIQVLSIFNRPLLSAGTKLVLYMYDNKNVFLLVPLIYSGI